MTVSVRKRKLKKKNKTKKQTKSEKRQETAIAFIHNILVLLSTHSAVKRKQNNLVYWSHKNGILQNLLKWDFEVKVDQKRKCRRMSAPNCQKYSVSSYNNNVKNDIYSLRWIQEMITGPHVSYGERTRTFIVIDVIVNESRRKRRRAGSTQECSPVEVAPSHDRPLQSLTSGGVRHEIWPIASRYLNNSPRGKQEAISARGVGLRKRRRNWVKAVLRKTVFGQN